MMEDILLESFPFESKLDGYDDYGYPVYDRAVGASMLRETYRKFFTDGLFGTPANAFEITKSIGMSVNISQGTAILNGAIASIPEEGLNVVIEETMPTQGTYAYGIFLRYDENFEKRGVYVTVRKGEASPTPTPPGIDESTPGVKEMRIGYVVLPTGSDSINYGTIYNEKGSEVFPFAFPFAEIDVSGLTLDIQQSTKEAYDYYISIISKYIKLLESSLDGTTAGNLQDQITALQIQVDALNDVIPGISDLLENVTGVE